MNAQQSNSNLKTGNGLMVVRTPVGIDECVLTEMGIANDTFVVTSNEYRDFYFKYDAQKRSIVSSPNIGNGMMLLAEGGQILSTGTVGLEWNGVEIADVSELLVIKIAERGAYSNASPSGQPKIKEVFVDANASSSNNAIATLNKLKKSRSAKFEEWVEVGEILFVIFSGEYEGLQIWDMWSGGSKDYANGSCSRKWREWSEGNRLQESVEEAYARLVSLAKNDSEDVNIQTAPKKALPSDYMTAVHQMGFSFRLNDMNDRLYTNLGLMSDGLDALIMTNLRQHEYNNRAVFKDAIVAEGEMNRFHPIKDYLNGQVWDGQDHIGKLAEYIKDKDGVFGAYLRKWLIGAVSKVLRPTSREQNPMLVIGGRQGLGKSVLAHFLGGVLPEFFIASAIFPDNKDFIINAASNLVWEVKELNGTIRKSEREALKGFIDTPMISFRAPYGRHEIKKFVTASYIGTVNFDGSGLLNDPTGHRRFRVCELESIDWNYEKDINPNQLWAQAVALFRGGETYLLDKEMSEKAYEINERYVVSEPLTDHILEYFEVDADKKDWFTPTKDIISVLRDKDVIPSEIDGYMNSRVAGVLTKLGLENVHMRVSGQRARGWLGIKRKMI